MNFNIELDEKHCMQNGKSCPMSDFDVMSKSGKCRYYNTALTGKGWYFRCPECLAGEEKQQDKRKICPTGEKANETNTGI